jgi:hypothetical protein
MRFIHRYPFSSLWTKDLTPLLRRAEKATRGLIETSTAGGSSEFRREIVYGFKPLLNDLFAPLIDAEKLFRQPGPAQK